MTAVSSLMEAQEQIRQERYDLALVDITLPDGCGQQLIEPLLARRQGGPPVVVMMSGRQDAEMACACIGEGAFDFMHKPFSLEEIDFLFHRARSFAHLLRQHEPILGGDGDERAPGRNLPPALLGHSAEVGQLRGMLRKVAPLETTVLILGERGAGKGQVAEVIHRMSHRAPRRLQRVNCSAGSEEQVEREIFGGCTREERWEAGRLEQADGGTLLLEEVSELSPKLQHRILRAMRERGFERDGEKREFVPLDVRYLLTSCKDLGEAVRSGCVRDDFYRQVHVLPIQVAPLRQRRGDLSLLAGEWLANFGRRIGIPPKGITPEALEVLIGHSWPGNLQEFESALERALVLGGVDCVIDAPAFDFLQEAPAFEPQASGMRLAPSPDSDAVCLEPLLSLEEMEKRHVLRALEYTNQNRTRAAGLLKISVRTLRNKLHLYRLQADEISARPENSFFSPRQQESRRNSPSRKSLR